ncbi:MAG: C13 family peptidase [Planctomycetota bacterium]|jgi:hypothetical protein
MKRSIFIILFLAHGVAVAAGEPFTSSGGYWKKYAKRFGIVVMAGNVEGREPHYGWYWNDTYRMVQFLREEGFPKEHVFYLTYGEKAKKHKDEVYGPSTTDNVVNVFAHVAGVAGPEDLVYLYWIDHGNQRGLETYDGEIGHKELGILFRQIKARVFIGAFNPCYSGALIDDVRSPNAIILTSTHASEPNSWGWASYWRAALMGGGAQGRSDADGNCRVTMAEAYKWTTALANEKGEHPQLDDNGDGKPGDLSAGTFDHADPGRDGFRAARFALDAWKAPLPTPFAWRDVRIQGASGPETDPRKRLAAFLGKQDFVKKARKAGEKARPLLLYCYSRARNRKGFTREATRCLAVNRKVFSVAEAVTVIAAGAHFTCFEADVTATDAEGSPDLNAATAPAVVLLDRSGAVSAFLKGGGLNRNALYKAMRELLPEVQRAALEETVEKVKGLTRKLESAEKRIASKRKDVLKVHHRFRGKNLKASAPHLAKHAKAIRAEEEKCAETVKELRGLFSR